jgi:hypothetical protein
LTNVESTETTESYDNFIDDQYFSTSNHSKYQILDSEDIHQIDRSGDQNSDQSTVNQLNEGRNDTLLKVALDTITPNPTIENVPKRTI